MKLALVMRFISYVFAITGFVVAIDGDSALATYHLAAAVWIWLASKDQEPTP